ncbi:uncharacterized protein F4807DRAFT_427634 [Annulohypoxylon truncatum]|uniref:uncharacterized protein n=1 Tax=Annulohypoxylon truncatum TaxID=327061 RepID=UPI00200868DF|nr:uncharacterized protein F4807DRAFT_427634 [Annulohypoxylon truncatum]KAI1209221.1 hypothetical protein F4807DRAFT_427634 [Annulohypoxylon truncatum]
MLHVSAVSGPSGGAFVATELRSIELSNQASAALRQGRADEAITLHKQALELKLQTNPELCVKTGITYNGLGEALLRAGRLDEADDAFSKALTIREREGPAQDAAMTRDNVGQLREAQGRFADAREVRLRGAAKKTIMCGNYDCPTQGTFALDKLSACSACKSVFYCSRACQKKDWATRHKPLCQAHTAASQPTKPADTQLNPQNGSQKADSQPAGPQDTTSA